MEPRIVTATFLLLFQVRTEQFFRGKGDPFSSESSITTALSGPPAHTPRPLPRRRQVYLRHGAWEERKPGSHDPKAHNCAALWGSL